MWFILATWMLNKRKPFKCSILNLTWFNNVLHSTTNWFIESHINEFWMSPISAPMEAITKINKKVDMNKKVLEQISTNSRKAIQCFSLKSCILRNKWLHRWCLFTIFKFNSNHDFLLKTSWKFSIIRIFRF